MISHFFAYMSRMKHIKRWGLMRNTVEENIQEHSQQVSVIAHSLAVIENKYYNGEYDPNYIAVLAMYHETSEIITGDLPTPIKYFNPNISKEYKIIEHMANKKILAMLPNELMDEYEDIIVQKDDGNHKIVKAADRVAAYIKCLEEISAGNREFQKAKETIERSIIEIEIKVSGILYGDVLIPSYLLTLDEMR